VRTIANLQQQIVQAARLRAYEKAFTRAKFGDMRRERFGGQLISRDTITCH